MAFSFSELGDSLQTSLGRRIDNELNSDFYPVPNSPSGETPKVQTANDETGVNKDAGTGRQLVKGINNSVVFGVGALIVGGIIFAAVKS